jgi:transcriptional regulator with XRE-family HTH domain
MRRAESGRLLISLGTMIREQRRAAGHSQEHLAELAGLHRNSLNAIERGSQDAEAVSLTNTIQVLGILAFKLDYETGSVRCTAVGPPGHPVDPAIYARALGRGLRQLRMAAAVSRERLATACGIHRNTIERIENARCRVTLPTLIALYRHFGVTEFRRSPAAVAPAALEFSICGNTLRFTEHDRPAAPASAGAVRLLRI